MSSIPFDAQAFTFEVLPQLEQQEAAAIADLVGHEARMDRGRREWHWASATHDQELLSRARREASTGS